MNDQAQANVARAICRAVYRSRRCACANKPPRAVCEIMMRAAEAARVKLAQFLPSLAGERGGIEGIEPCKCQVRCVTGCWHWRSREVARA